MLARIYRWSVKFQDRRERKRRKRKARR